MGGKWLEVLKEFVPVVSRVAIMFNPVISPHIASGYYLEALQAAGERLTVNQQTVPVRDPIVPLDVGLGTGPGAGHPQAFA